MEIDQGAYEWVRQMAIGDYCLVLEQVEGLLPEEADRPCHNDLLCNPLELLNSMMQVSWLTS